MDDIYVQANGFKGVTVCHRTFQPIRGEHKNYISSKPGGVDGRGLGWPKLQLLHHFIQDSFMIEMLIINMTLIKALRVQVSIITFSSIYNLICITQTCTTKLNSLHDCCQNRKADYKEKGTEKHLPEQSL